MTFFGVNLTKEFQTKECITFLKLFMVMTLVFVFQPAVSDKNGANFV